MRYSYQKTKTPGKRTLTYWRNRLAEVRRCATLEDSRFAKPHHPDDLPKCEDDVDEFIRERTRLFRQTWVIAPLDEILEEISELLKIKEPIK